MSAVPPQHECCCHADHGNHSEEMLIMNHEAVLRAEVDYRQRRFLDEAEADRVAKQVRKTK
jgi:hypothetical protein